MELRIYPLIKTTFYILFILFCLGAILYVSIVLPNYCFNKFKYLQIPCNEPQTVCNISNLSNQNFNNHQRISLKGRVKRNPNNINYNELFIEGNGKLKKKKGLIKNQVEEEEEKLINHNNLDDFFERVKEKKQFECYFINKNKEIQNDSNKEIPILITESNHQNKLTPSQEYLNEVKNLHHGNVKCDDLLIFENKKIDYVDQESRANNDKIEVNSKFEENNKKLEKLIQYAIPTSPITKINSPLKEKIEIHQTITELPIEEELNESQRMENKMKNSDFFAQTPLTNIRRYTNPKNK
jgi:hypothetical protein